MGSPYEFDASFIPLYECSFSKLRDHNPLEKEVTDFTKKSNIEHCQQEALKKLRMMEVLPSGFDNYNRLNGVWKQEQMTFFQDFVRWYKKDVVPRSDSENEGILS